MAAPTYGTDLLTIDLAQGNTWSEYTLTGWVDLNSVTQTDGDTDDYIQGTACNTAGVSTAKTGVGGLMYNMGTPITIPTDGAFLIWVKYDLTGSLLEEASGGVRTTVGNSLSAFYYFNQLGKSSYPYGGWVNLATGDPASVTPSGSAGSPSGSLQYFGWAFGISSAPSKGTPYKVDAARYGRCELQISAGDSGTPATFSGLATYNDYNDATNGYNRFGLFQAVNGGYLWKGLITIGYSSAAYFSDSNKNISIDNTKWVTSGFNKIVIQNSGTYVYWTNINITSLSTVSKGIVSVTAGTTINFSSCTFTDMDTFTFASGVPVDVSSCTFRRCGLVTQGSDSTTIYDCLFDRSTATIALKSTYLNAVTDTTFISDGTGHAIEVAPSGAGPHTLTLDACSFTGYASSDGSTGNEALLIHPSTNSANITINVTNGTLPSVMEHADYTGTFTISSSVLVKVTVVDSDTNPIYLAQVAIYVGSTEVVNIDTDIDGEVNTAYSGSTPTPCIVRVRKSSTGSTRYFSKAQPATIRTTGLDITISLDEDTIAS
jgi:hypothetical protein